MNLHGLFNTKFIRLEEQWWYCLTHSWEDKKGSYLFQGYLSKVNIIVWLEFGLAYNNIAVHCLTIKPWRHRQSIRIYLSTSFFSSIYISIHILLILFIYLSINLSKFVHIYLSIYLSIYRPISIRMLVRLLGAWFSLKNFRYFMLRFKKQMSQMFWVGLG